MAFLRQTTLGLITIEKEVFVSTSAALISSEWNVQNGAQHSVFSFTLSLARFFSPLNARSQSRFFSCPHLVSLIKHHQFTIQTKNNELQLQIYEMPIENVANALIE